MATEEDDEDDDGTAGMDLAAASDDVELSVARSNRPEDLVMAMTGGTASTERSARDSLNFAVKFAANSMILVLEQLRKMPKLRPAYHDIAGRVFAFLDEYRRKNECLRLCRSMQHHLREFRQAAEESDAGRMSDVAQASLITTLFSMLSHCAGLQLWNQAFSTAEKIHENLTSFGVGAAPHLMATFYDRLGAIFWVSDNRLFHAYATFRRFSDAAKDATDRQLLADRVLLAAMCIPRFQADGDAEAEKLEGDVEKESHSRLAALLSFSSSPSRAALLADICGKDIASVASAPVRELFRILETANPSTRIAHSAAKAMGAIFGAVPAATAASSTAAAAAAAEATSAPPTLPTGAESGFAQYARPLAEQALLLQARQLQRSYSSMTRDCFFDIIAPLGLDGTEAEQLVVAATRARFVNLRVGHREGVIRFSHADFTSDGMRAHMADLGRKMRSAVAMMAAQDVASRASRVADDAAAAAAAGLPLSDADVRAKAFTAAREAIVASQLSATNRTTVAKQRAEAIQAEHTRQQHAVRHVCLSGLPLRCLPPCPRLPYLPLTQDCSGSKTLRPRLGGLHQFDTLAITVSRAPCLKCSKLGAARPGRLCLAVRPTAGCYRWLPHPSQFLAACCFLASFCCAC